MSASIATRYPVSERHPLGVDMYHIENEKLEACDPYEDCIASGVTTIIYAYENHGYEGSGVAIYEANGQWYEHNMGHCSCYGAWDDGYAGDNALTVGDNGVDINEIVSWLKTQDGYNGEYRDAIIAILIEKGIISNEPS